MQAQLTNPSYATVDTLLLQMQFGLFSSLKNLTIVSRKFVEDRDVRVARRTVSPNSRGRPELGNRTKKSFESDGNMTWKAGKVRMQATPPQGEKFSSQTMTEIRLIFMFFR